MEARKACWPQTVTADGHGAGGDLRVLGLGSHWTRLSPETAAISLQSFIFPSCVCVNSSPQGCGQQGPRIKSWITEQFTALHLPPLWKMHLKRGFAGRFWFIHLIFVYLFYCIWFFLSFEWDKKNYVLMFVFLYDLWPWPFFFLFLIFLQFLFIF